jgi:hypothetical protein
MSRKLFPILAILTVAVVSMACTISFNLPSINQVKVGPTQTETIQVAAPTSGATSDVTLAFGAGELNVSPGAENALVEGTATYNVKELKPQVTVTGSTVRIETGDFSNKGFGNLNFAAKDLKNTWDLKLGSFPMNLHIKAGAYKGDYELGGLALESLDVADGASQVGLKFSQPNTVPMDNLRYETGASNVNLSGLANADFQNMTFRGGAGNYTLDFSGTLKRDATVNIESGISQITIVVPKGVSAQVVLKGALSNVNMDGAWQKSGGNYVNSGSGPQITIYVTMGAGNLQLSN